MSRGRSPSAAASTPRRVDDVIWGASCRSGRRPSTSAAAPSSPPAGLRPSPRRRSTGGVVPRRSVHFAAAGLMSRQYDVVVAGGVEVMSRVPLRCVRREHRLRCAVCRFRPRPLRRPDVQPGIGAEMMADKWGFSRQAQDEFAGASHAKLADAIDAGRLTGQYAPSTCRWWPARGRRGPAAGNLPRRWQALTRLPRRRHRPRRQLLADQRRRRGAVVDDVGEGGAASG